MARRATSPRRASRCSNGKAARSSLLNKRTELFQIRRREETSGAFCLGKRLPRIAYDDGKPRLRNWLFGTSAPISIPKDSMRIPSSSTSQRKEISYQRFFERKAAFGT